MAAIVAAIPHKSEEPMKLKDIYGPEVAKAVLQMERTPAGNFRVYPAAYIDIACIVGACNLMAYRIAGLPDPDRLMPKLYAAINDAKSVVDPDRLGLLEKQHIAKVITDWDAADNAIDLPEYLDTKDKIIDRELR